MGAGFAGVSTALHLQLLATQPVDIHLFDPELPGRGVAYGLADSTSLLNVPVERMGLWAHDPLHFLHWLQAQGYTVSLGTFLPRQLYGDYLQEQLNTALALPGTARIFLHADEVTQITPQEAMPGARTGFDVYTSKAHFNVSHCVLALGNFAPAPLSIASPAFYKRSRYFSNPWKKQAVQNLSPDAPILLLGSGLTAVDVVLALKKQGHQGVIHLLSRHGVLPLAIEKPTEPSPVFTLTPGDRLQTLWRQVSQQLRLLSPHQPPSSAHMQAVAMGLRPHFSGLWQGLSEREQRQFLRHLHHFWSQARHCLPSEVSHFLQSLLQAKRLRLLAGKALDLTDSPEGVSLLYRKRGADQTLVLNGIERVINCTGPSLDYHRVSSQLMQQLISDGIIYCHPLRLGLMADFTGQLLDFHKQPIPGLYTLGSALRGVLWECTAVPEIRMQAQGLAKHILA